MPPSGDRSKAEMVMVIAWILLQDRRYSRTCEVCMNQSIRLILAFAALVTFSAHAADITGNWKATIVTATGQGDYTFAFRQDGGKLIGTAKSQDGVASISNGYINYKTITFTENVTVEGRRVVLDYTGELVSDTEIRFKRQAAGAANPAVEFVATRVGRP